MTRKREIKRGITTGEAAELLSCNINTVIRLCRSGDMPHWKIGIGQHRRIALSDVLQYAQDYNIPIPDEAVRKFWRRRDHSVEDDN